MQKANRWFTFRNRSRKMGVTLLIAELVENTQQQAFQFSEEQWAMAAASVRKCEQIVNKLLTV